MIYETLKNEDYTMKHKWIYGILLLSTALPVAWGAGQSAADPVKPNIVVVVADDMGWGDSAPYGHKLIQTPNQRVAMRIGDWKLVGDETLTHFQISEFQKDWKEENDLASKMPEKTEEMKNILLKLWADIEAEGPNEWWESDRQKSRFGGKLSY